MKSITVVLRALSPIAHGSFGPSTGNSVLFRRLPVVSIPGSPRIPAVSGNSLRGILRRIVMRDLLERAGLNKTTPRWDHLYAALVNGGHLQGSEASLDPVAIGELRAALPPLSAFGAALRTWMLEGRVEVGICWPRCAETHAAGLVSAGGLSAEEFIHEYSQVRHVDRGEQDPSVTGVTPMPTTTETLATGTILESVIIARSKSTPEECSAIAYGLGQLHAIGAKSAAGLGRVTVEHDGDAAPYAAWLESGIDGARDALLELAEKLAGAETKKTRRPKDAPTPATVG